MTAPKPFVFVLMPFAASFDDVYKLGIAPACEEVGARCERIDQQIFDESILARIYKQIGTADIVVAEMTGRNPNVFYETGFAHAIGKIVILLTQDASDIPFDLKQYPHIVYSGRIADLKSQLATRVKFFLGQSSRQSGLEPLLKEAKASGYVQVIDLLLDQADEKHRLSGAGVIETLRRSAEKGNGEGLARDLREALKSPYLYERDYLAIARLCQEASRDEHRRATLEIAYRRYSDSDVIVDALADACDDSDSPEDKQRGVAILELKLGIVRSGALPVWKEAIPEIYLRRFGLLFNLYFGLKDPASVVSLADSLNTSEPVSAGFVARNKARALADLGRDGAAEQEYLHALELDSRNESTVSWYADFLDDRGRFEAAYLTLEDAAAGGATPELLVNLAIQIINRGFVRVQVDKIEGPVPRAERRRRAVPLLLFAASESQEYQLRERVARILAREGALESAKQLLSNENAALDTTTFPLAFVLGKHP